MKNKRKKQIKFSTATYRNDKEQKYSQLLPAFEMPKLLNVTSECKSIR